MHPSVHELLLVPGMPLGYQQLLFDPHHHTDFGSMPSPNRHLLSAQTTAGGAKNLILPSHAQPGACQAPRLLPLPLRLQSVSLLLTPYGGPYLCLPPLGLAHTSPLTAYSKTPPPRGPHSPYPTHEPRSLSVLPHPQRPTPGRHEHPSPSPYGQHLQVN